MKLKNTLLYAAALSAGMMATSCDDFLDRAPITQITPDSYFKQDSELGAYTVNYYESIFRGPRDTYSAGPVLWDGDTDNMVSGEPNTQLFGDNNWLVGANQTMNFGLIRACNYFFDKVLPKYEANQIQGDPNLVKHYIGEMYFIRAAAYYKNLVKYGDYPIVEGVLEDDLLVLSEASRRAPRNEVARFILSDLDKAIEMCQSKAFKKNRISKEAAQLMKARVALFEATFEKYHTGTPRVPGEEGWPGAKMEYNAGKTFNIPGEIDFFLSEAMEASKAVADSHALTENSHKMNPDLKQIAGWNPYFEMFSSVDLSGYDEVLLWRAYSTDKSVMHGYNDYIMNGGGDNGMTKSYVDAFVMQSGLPIYATNSGYKGDVTIDNQKADRDERLQLFVLGESDYTDVTSAEPIQFIPTLLDIQSQRDRTGFRQRKHGTYDPAHWGPGINGFTGFVEMRATEAYLIYLEASYLKNGSIDATADSYWKMLRERAGVNPDYMLTVNATDLSKEPDWAKYSGTELVDPLLYNIRRERRCEFIGEGMRWDDLKRWRSMDMLKYEKYIPEGVNFWTELYKNEAYYDETTHEPLFKEQAAGVTDANVSSREVSKYLRPYQLVKENNQVFDGYKWMDAYYLSPLGAQDFTLTQTGEGEATVQNVYQNPYWPEQASQGALQ